MYNSKYIEEIKSYIITLKKDIEGTQESWKKQALLRLPLAQTWLELLHSGDVSESQFESFAKKIFEIENSDEHIWYLPSILFCCLSSWSKETGMLTSKFKNWETLLRVKFYIKYYEKFLRYDKNQMSKVINNQGLTIAQKWLGLINSSSNTQTDIDSIMNEFLSPKELWGSGWSGMTYDFREWAEANGFSVPSYEEVKDYYDSIFQDSIRKIREEKLRKKEK